jgi:hypothetical protein
MNNIKVKHTRATDLLLRKAVKEGWTYGRDVESVFDGGGRIIGVRQINYKEELYMSWKSGVIIAYARDNGYPFVAVRWVNKEGNNAVVPIDELTLI